MDCFRCGADDHLYRDCPEEPPPSATTSVSNRPAWCGECDQRTRLIDHGDYMQRCYRCWAWPSRGTYPHQPLFQHTACGGCGETIHTWDHAPCGKHQPLGIDKHGRRALAQR